MHLSTLMMEAAGSSETSVHFYQTVLWGVTSRITASSLLSTDPYCEYFCHILTHCGPLSPFCLAGLTAGLQRRKCHKNYSTHSTWKSWNQHPEVSPMTNIGNTQTKYCSISDSLSSYIEFSLCPDRKGKN